MHGHFSRGMSFIVFAVDGVVLGDGVTGDAVDSGFYRCIDVLNDESGVGLLGGERESAEEKWRQQA
jgi:hypothetical protein